MTEISKDALRAIDTEGKLALLGGEPVRTQPLPLEFPGVHHMDEEEIEAAVRVLRSRSPFRFYGIALQGEVDAFEREFEDFLGVPHTVAVTSGTAALHTALSALGVGPGQEVILPAYLWVSVAAAVVNLGAIPVIADINDTFCLDPTEAERRITPRTTGIVAVHMSGAQADVPELAKIAQKHGLFLLEDCAQCAGGSIQGKKVGTFGDIGIFSFQMNKNMTSGEGGCVVTSDDRLYQRIVACHDLGYARGADGRLIMDQPELCLWGHGVRLDEIRASVLRVQLRKLPRVIGNMHDSKYRIRKTLEQMPGIALRRIVDPAGDTGCFLLVTFPDEAIAKTATLALRAEGIVTWPQGLNTVVMTDWGLHIYSNIASLVQKASIDKKGFPWNLAENAGSKAEYKKGTCPVADDLFSRTVLIAIPSCLSQFDEEDIVRAFQKVLEVLSASASVVGK